MDFLQLKKRTYSYLGFRSVGQSAETDEAITQCFAELQKIAHFRYIYKFLETPPAFLNVEPYLEYLKGSVGVIVCVMTLGGEVDRRIKYYERTDAALAVIMDACASAYLEELSDEYEASLNLDLSYRFCPGYGGSSTDDIREIFRILQPEKIGLSLTESNFILPCKSMAGIVAVGKKAEKNCNNCAVFGHCEYRKEGVTCYGSVKK
ncbi:MAG: hypothetical protein K2N17_02560 [Clostridia bacterium]|nr:hypothetical protein [Clostridia bacterium]